jgi:DNA primase
MGAAAERISDDLFRDMVSKARGQHLLSDIVGRHTDLKKRGNREKVGLCCFHQERTPSLEVNDDKGTYYCHGCGASGDAISFLTSHENMSFRQAVETLSGDTFPVISDEERAKRKAESERKQGERLAIARNIWANAGPVAGTPAEVYARSRGITMELPGSVRFGMTPRWRDPETGELGRDFPAMVCAIQNADGDLAGVQCVFLELGGRRKYSRPRPDGSAAKAKLTYGLLVGGAFRLGPVSSEIVCCEGPEDGLTLAQQLPGKSVWVSCGTAALPKMQFPPEVQSVILAGDNNEAGREAAATAHQVYLARGLSVQEVYPDAPFKDWNDQLRGVRTACRP